MTIDQNYAVDTLLAQVDVETLMTRAFELTHRIHAADRDEEANPHATRSPGGRAGALRLERDAIVREMQRRSDGLERALVTIEATERVMRGVDETLANAAVWMDEASPTAQGDVAEAREALDMAMERTTTTTCSLVKDQTVSDRIAAQARDIVKPIKDRAREVGAAARA